MSTLTAALRAVDAQFAEMKQTLLDLARIPGVSAAGFPPGEVRRSAQAFADLLRRIGLENVEILEIPGVHPYVHGDWIKHPGAPTLLLYGHHDVVPPGGSSAGRARPSRPSSARAVCTVAGRRTTRAASSSTWPRWPRTSAPAARCPAT
jgi:acetylornithine deacetylase/succinyl-diaminopimelate desuccinylase-like protein